MKNPANIFWTMLICSCSIILSSCTAIQEFLWTSEKTASNDIFTDTKSFIDKLGFSENEIYFMDKEYLDEYVTFLEKGYPQDTINLLRDPAQIIYFDSLGAQVSFNSMTMSGIKFPALSLKADWTSYGMYEEFPPCEFYDSPEVLKLQDKVDFTDTSACKFTPAVFVERDSLIKYLKPFPGNTTKDISKELNQYDYSVFILGTTFILRNNTKYQVKTVRKNLKKKPAGVKVKTIFIMSETMFDSMIADSLFAETSE